MMVTRKDKAVRAKKARKLGISSCVIYHSVNKLNYSARLYVFRSVYLRVYRILPVGGRKSVFVEIVIHNNLVKVMLNPIFLSITVLAVILYCRIDIRQELPENSNYSRNEILRWNRRSYARSNSHLWRAWQKTPIMTKIR